VARVITSANNGRIKLVRRLASRRQREREGLFVCEGEDLVRAGLEAGAQPVHVFVDADRPLDVEGAEPVAPALLREISSLGHHTRVLAVFRRDDLPHAAEGGGLALWRVADPGNVGTLLRAADAFGAGYVALSAGCADPTGPKALRAAAGAIFRVAVVPFDDAPRPWTALATRGGTPVGDAQLPRDGTLVLGAEREGLPADVTASCEGVVSIPQAGDAESLNVAMAGTVGLYEWARRSIG
jgi:RNA methyltransferase, TrmH family